MVLYIAFSLIQREFFFHCVSIKSTVKFLIKMLDIWDIFFVTCARGKKETGIFTGSMRKLGKIGRCERKGVKMKYG